ncbi:MAG: DUF2461 domain-containing protein [Thermoplasmata archaeon]|nr:DUF2461 domain-containing protein [Thermoplasmata archaeon]
MDVEPVAKSGFSSEFFRFLRELAKNNDRGWFNANKSRYLEQVQAPSLAFVRSVGPKLGKVSRHLLADPRPVGGSIMRIYRDTRFSKDKSPYRTSVGIHFMHEATREGAEHLPGFFLHLAPSESWVYAGMWQPEKAMLDQIRHSIVDRTPEWRKVRASVPEVEGESLKRPPPGFDPDHPFVSDLKRKGFTSGLPMKDSEVIAPGFEDRFVAQCKSLDPLNRFLARAVGAAY